MDRKNIERAALGRSANLGELYDIRTECFLKDTLFLSKLEDDDIDSMELGDISTQLVLEDNLDEKFKTLDVQASLKVSVISGLVNLSGSGSYLGETRKSARARSMSLVCHIRTLSEDIMIRQHKKNIDMDVLSSKEHDTDATHAVVGIEWGAACAITCEDENKANEDVTEIKGNLKAAIKALSVCVDGDAKVEYDDKTKDTFRKFSFSCKSDVSQPGKELPTSFEGAVELAKDLPSIVKNTNGGKGVPLTYYLLSLNTIVKMCRLQIQLQMHYKAIDEHIITKCTQVVEGIRETRQALWDVHSDLHEYADYVTEDSLSRIDDKMKKFSVNESRFQGSLQVLVKKVRTGEEDISSLEIFLSKEDLPHVQQNEDIREFEKDMIKVDFIKLLTSKGVTYIGRRHQFNPSEEHSYVLYKTSRETSPAIHDKNLEFFLRLHKTHAKNNKYGFYVVDQELRGDLWPAGKKQSTIYMLRNGNKCSDDLYAKEGCDTEMCLIKLGKPAYNRTARPSDRANVKLKCPNALFGNGECKGNLVIWKCSKCKEVIEFGIKSKRFYCDCGFSYAEDLSFRCGEQAHGMDYVKYPEEEKHVLDDQLSNLRAIRECNILILGETGVGKSTWINGFSNYLNFANLEEAVQSEDFLVMIPSSFTFTHDGKEDVILVGEQDPNENMEAGQSATNKPLAYKFYKDDLTVRLIDTPGIGDSRGIDQDKKNFDSILQHLHYYTEIHAVCILLKPNNARLTAVFRFCVQELLAHLHSSAKENIVFCFTNARATFYQPGDTLPALNKELRDKKVGIQAVPKNYFCFDNEPFRFLACVKHGVKFTQDDFKTYATSWDRSVDTTNRLFSHITTLPPHNVQSTLSMNTARSTIVAMSKPLAEVAGNISNNLESVKRSTEDIDNFTADLKELKKKLHVEILELKKVDLGYPRTVCADPSCIEYKQVGKDGNQQVIYTTICHEHCYIAGVETQTVNDERLKHCAAFSSSNCSGCGHHYTKHMHITYESELHPASFLSPEVEEKIANTTNAKEAKEKYKTAIHLKAKELEAERLAITQAMAQFGSFLKRFAMIPYNDAVGDYLDLCIELEEHKDKEVRRKAYLEDIKRMKTEYEHMRHVLDDALDAKHDDEKIKSLRTPEQVHEHLKTLFALKHNGGILKSYCEGSSATTTANRRSYRHVEKTVPFKQAPRKKPMKEPGTMAWIAGKAVGAWRSVTGADDNNTPSAPSTKVKKRLPSAQLYA